MTKHPFTSLLTRVLRYVDTIIYGKKDSVIQRLNKNLEKSKSNCNKLSIINSSNEDLIYELEKKLNNLNNGVNSDDTDYWNTHWKQTKIFYSAPKSKWVCEYLKYSPHNMIQDISREIMKEYNPFNFDYDKVPLVVMKWVKEQNFKYVSDIKENWNSPEKTLKERKGDCDDIGILEYYLIREIFKQLNVWKEVKHRLKCVCGNVNARGQIPSGVGGHFYLNWLGYDSKWYIVESTYYLNSAIANFEKLPQKLNPMYGVIWFTFNEEYSWNQFSLSISKLDFKKNKIGG